MDIDWILDWTDPPTSTQQLDCWILYIAIWEEAQLTPAGFYINRWLKNLGWPGGANDPTGFYQLALDRFLYPAPNRRR